MSLRNYRVWCSYPGCDNSYSKKTKAMWMAEEYGILELGWQTLKREIRVSKMLCPHHIPRS